MTLEPRVAKIRKPGEESQDVEFSPSDDAATGETDTPAAPTPKQRATGRELRRARRKARRLGLEPIDDHDAIRMLKERGIDHNADDSIMEMLPGGGQSQQDQGSDGVVQLPAETLQTGLATQQDNAGILDEAARAFEIASIQKQLVKRRRRRLALLFLKLAFFIALPTFLVGHYYYNTASDMYETKSEFVIQKSEGSGGGNLGGLFAGTGFATSQDSIAVQGYLTSREAMARLDEEQGFVGHFQQDTIDDIQRLAPDATTETAYKLFQKRVKVGFDPTEGIIRMEVIAATPEASQRFAEALISFAEERVDQLSARVRQDQMAGASAAYDNAEQAVVRAQERVLFLQQERGVLSAEAEISAQMSIINSLELEREAKLLDLAEMRANARPNETRIAVLTAEIERMDARILELRQAMTQNSDTSTSLAKITGELTVAEADLANRQLMLQTALQQVINAQIEADRQVRYLSLGVAPVATDVASYPRKLENTILAFVIFSSIYILVSLTVSILREQVSV